MAAANQLATHTSRNALIFRPHRPLKVAGVPVGSSYYCFTKLLKRLVAASLIRLHDASKYCWFAASESDQQSPGVLLRFPLAAI